MIVSFQAKERNHETLMKEMDKKLNQNNSKMAKLVSELSLMRAKIVDLENVKKVFSPNLY